MNLYKGDCEHGYSSNYIMIVIFAISVGYSVVNHGKQRGRYNLWDALIGGGIELLILYWGGFFG